MHHRNTTGSQGAEPDKCFKLALPLRYKSRPCRALLQLVRKQLGEDVHQLRDFRLEMGGISLDLDSSLELSIGSCEDAHLIATYVGAEPTASVVKATDAAASVPPRRASAKAAKSTKAASAAASADAASTEVTIAEAEAAAAAAEAAVTAATVHAALVRSRWSRWQDQLDAIAADGPVDGRNS